jgi:uroporphyrinogen decarboxylase
MGMSFAVSVQPDVEELLKVLRRVGTPRRLHHLELFLDREIREAVRARFDLGVGPGGRDTVDAELSSSVRIHHFLGYDVFRVEVIHKDVFPMSDLRASDTAAGRQSRGQREWVEEHRGPIQSWEDFERYPWPEVSAVNLRALEWMEKNIPDGMGCYDLTAHVLEMVTFLQGYETLCYNLFDAPELVAAICERVGRFYVEYTRVLCDFDSVAVIWGSDDMGFRSSTMVSPEFLRRHILPWHKACADVAKAAGKPYLLHACGHLDEIMEDLIDTVGIDGKHSFEDAILPVTEAFHRYGERISILGGIDVDFLCRADEQAVRRRVRETLERCAAPGKGRGYCLGTGNTVANYIPMGNYLAMLDEGRRFGL